MQPVVAFIAQGLIAPIVAQLSFAGLADLKYNFLLRESLIDPCDGPVLYFEMVSTTRGFIAAFAIKRASLY